MSTKIQKTNNHWFFTNPINHQALPVNNTDKKPTFDNTGGRWQHIIAAEIFNNFIIRPRMMSAEFLKKLLSLFPESETKLPGLVTPNERMQQLLKQNHKSVLIKTLAISLQQIAEHELKTNSTLYPEAFVHQHEQLIPDEMHKPSARDKSNIVALSKALDMPIEVHVIESGRILAQCIIHNANGKAAPPVVIQQEGSYYVPRVTLSGGFKNVQSQSMPVLKVTIDTTNERLFKMAESTYRKLNNVFNDKDINEQQLLINKKQLQDVYIKAISNNDTQQFIDGELTYRNYFTPIARAKLTASNTISPVKAMLHELMLALACDVAISRITEDDLFALIENHQETQTASALKR